MISLSARPPTITSTHHGGYVRIAAALAVVCMLIFLIVRLFVRRPWIRLFGMDDWVTLAASLCALCQSVLVLCSVNAGLGTASSELSSDQIDKALKLLYASDLLFVPTLFAGELAVALFFLRLSGPNRNFFHQTARVIVGASILAAGLSLLMLAIRVKSGVPTWKIVVVGHDTIFYRWVVVGILSMLIEALLIVCPTLLFWSLQMPLHQKLGCSVYFALRFPTMVLTVVRLVSLAHAKAGDDVTFDMTMPAVFAQIEMHFTVLAATIPILRNPLTQLNTGYLNTTLAQIDPEASAAFATKGSSNGKDQSYELSDVSSGKHSDSRGVDSRPSGGVDIVAEAATESAEERESMLSEGSDRIIIKRTVVIDYT